jgi:6-phosphogluconolactonase (cycloisomerase 2 family)
MPTSLALLSSGQFLYAGNNGAGTVSQYSINATTGSVGEAPSTAKIPQQADDHDVRRSWVVLLTAVAAHLTRWRSRLLLS